jgi:hypothetical protein
MFLTGCTEPPPQPTVQDYYRVFDQTLGSLKDAPSKRSLSSFSSIAVVCRDMGKLSSERSQLAQSIVLTRGLTATNPTRDSYSLWIVTTPSKDGVDVLLTLWDENSKERLWRKNGITAADKDKAS